MNTSFTHGKVQKRSVFYNDENFSLTKREFYIDIPEDYNINKKYPVLFYLHWHYGSGYIQRYVDEGRKQGFITVFPQGMHDDPNDDTNTGWAVPWQKNDDQICTATTKSYCYESCKKLDLCYHCSWTTCYNDSQFVQQLVEHLHDELCLDSNHLYISGASNGGMFVYYLSSQLPNLFKGWLVMYGLPLVGYINSQKSQNNQYVLYLHGRQDMLIPIKGGIDNAKEYIYESGDIMITEWANAQNCDLFSYQHVQTPYDDYVKNPNQSGYDLKCFEYTKGCKGRVMRCLYDGTHASNIPYDSQLAYWFFSN